MSAASQPRLPPRRAAGLDDAPALAALLQRCMKDPWQEEMLRTALGLRGAVALVAESRPGHLAGAVLVHLVKPEAEVLQLAVSPEARRMGLARVLLSEGLLAAARRGASDAYLEVRESNAAARALYRRHGFCEVGRRRGYYADGEDALVLALNLTPPP